MTSKKNCIATSSGAARPKVQSTNGGKTGSNEKRILDISATYIPLESPNAGTAPDDQGDLITFESYAVRTMGGGFFLSVILPVDDDLRTSIRQLEKIVGRLKKNPRLINKYRSGRCANTVDLCHTTNS